ncbi:MAG TPA: anti-sigma-V factor rsiV [Chloroflexi bacterium]|jgi:hypothetical protein|nr:anti-sigma-V factor rsiV [Chloroflexota bacterium]
MHERLAEMKRAYEAIPVPPELHPMIDALCRRERPRRHFWRPLVVAAACTLTIFVVSINAMPAVAESLEGVPVLGPVVKVLTVASYRREEQGATARVDIAQITGLANQELEDAINAELRTDGQALIDKFERDVAELKERLGEDATIPMTIETYYDVKRSDEEVFSLEVEYFWAAGGSDTQKEYYNINQQTGDLITLDALFADGSDYLTVINDYLIAQMRAETREDGRSIYWVNDDDLAMDRFTGIAADHDFYINEAGRLVIAFDKYEVAPGYVGTPEFEIPPELIADLLAEGAPLR